MMNGTTTNGTASGGGSGLLVGGVGVVFAAGVGLVFWRQSRKKQGHRRPDTMPLAPITIQLTPRALRDPLALSPPAHPSARPGQEPTLLSSQAAPYPQAPWEQTTMVDIRWAPSLPPADTRYLERDQPEVSPPPGSPALAPPAPPAPGRHAAQQPRMAPPPNPVQRPEHR